MFRGGIAGVGEVFRELPAGAWTSELIGKIRLNMREICSGRHGSSG